MPIETIKSTGKRNEPVMLFGNQKITMMQIDDYLGKPNTPFTHAVIVAAFRCGVIEKGKIRKRYPSIIDYCVPAWESSAEIKGLMETAGAGGIPRPARVETEEPETEGVAPLDSVVHTIQNPEQTVFTYGVWKLERKGNIFHYHSAITALPSERHGAALEMLFRTPEEFVSKERIFCMMMKRPYQRGETIVGDTIRDIRIKTKKFTGRDAPFVTQRGGYMLFDTLKDW